jgi:glutamate-1-semialdehyde aminotransferase
LPENADQQAEKNYFRHLLTKGILAMTPSEVHFYVSLPHTEEEIEKTLTATEDFLRSDRK